jgi:F-type H+-transporting ATPase subunit b
MRRIRLLLVAAAVVLVGLFGFAGVATAAPTQKGASVQSPATEEAVHEAEENGATEADAECIEIIAEGGTVDDCQEAPNPLLPETNEIIWGAFGFAVVFFFLWKFGVPQAKKAMEARTERIRGDLDAAEANRTEAETVLAEYQRQLADARNESARIIEEARQTADAMKADLQARADADITEQRQRAAADIEAAKAQALTDLRSEVASLAIGAAEEVVGHSLDQATNEALVEDYINRVGATT